MRCTGFYRLVVVGALGVFCPAISRAMDMRFDVATGNHTADDTDYFGPGQLAYLNFPTANGHMINQGSSSNAATIGSAGNQLGMYYNSFNGLYSPTTSPHDAAETIQTWINKQFNAAHQGDWLVLNEVSSSIWSGSNGNDYRSWLVNVMQILKNGDNSDPANPIPAHQGIILYAPFANPGSSNASTWQAISQYAYIGDECYVSGQTVKADNFAVNQIQPIYQSSFNSWTINAKVPASRLILGEEFTVTLSSSNIGAAGLSGSDWQAAIEARDLAIHNIPFGGFIGYAWSKNAQATGNSDVDAATQESYEAAYASTMVVQSEVPAWTNETGSNSWANYLNWTGGLPSTTLAPYSLLAASNPNLPKQTSANFLGNAIQSPTTINLDGDQSVTTLTFDTASSCTISPGTGGSLTFSGVNSAITVGQGSHTIAAGVVLANDVSANLAGDLTVSGGLANNGHTLTKSGAGALTLSGAQQNSRGSAISLVGGVLNLDTDAGTATAGNLSISASAGDLNFDSAQHLASLSLTGGNATIHTAGQYLMTNAADISAGSTLDLGKNDLIINYTGPSPMASIRSDLLSGYDGGKWDGTGIDSSSIAAVPFASLGYAEASDALNLTGSMTGDFDGQSVDSTTLLVKYTWIGDANLDGVVNSEDLAMMEPGGTTWATGDFNYDGVVNADDYALFSLASAYSGQANISSTVPEPASAGLAISGLLVMVASRSRRQRS